MLLFLLLLLRLRLLFLWAVLQLPQRTPLAQQLQQRLRWLALGLPLPPLRRRLDPLLPSPLQRQPLSLLLFLTHPLPLVLFLTQLLSPAVSLALQMRPLSLVRLSIPSRTARKGSPGG